jgi:hypothetical protein
MKNYVWLPACVAIVAAALVAGCGGGGSTTSAPAATEVTPATNTGSSTTEVSGATPDDVYNACLDAISGTAAEQAGQAGCAQARDAFEQCQTAAENASGSAQETAMKACQDAADKATAALKAAAP